MAAIAAANDNLVTLVWQQAEAKEQEEREERAAAVGSFSFRVSGFG